MNRILNLRADVPGHFMDDASLHRREWEFHEARKRQPYRFAVSPGSSLRTFDGRVLGPGDEVRLGDFRNDPGAPPAHQVLENLVVRGIVLESDTVR